MIFIALHIKKRRFFEKERITGNLYKWIGEALVEGDDLIARLSPRLTKHFRKPAHRQYIIDSLINTRKNISGAAAENIVSLYVSLGLKNDSLRKLHSMTWYRKSRGIYELYMMTQHDVLPEIAKLANSGSDAVRTEAQTALVGFKGFKGLSFLDTLTHPLNEWQQVKLLEQLNKLDPEEMEGLEQWLESQNEDVVLFALKLTDIFSQLHLHDAIVVRLGSANERLRAQAIKTLGRIANHGTPAVLKATYAAETMANKKNILRQLCSIGDDNDLPFLIEKLDEPDDALKLEAGRAITRCDSKGTALLEEIANSKEGLLPIFKQIKYELSR
ncbi:MAG: HEAT repeat domain-containing protein [Bacteroidota bacterium]